MMSTLQNPPKCPITDFPNMFLTLEKSRNSQFDARNWEYVARDYCEFDPKGCHIFQIIRNLEFVFFGAIYRFREYL